MTRGTRSAAAGRGIANVTIILIYRDTALSYDDFVAHRSTPSMSESMANRLHAIAVEAWTRCPKKGATAARRAYVRSQLCSDLAFLLLEKHDQGQGTNLLSAIIDLWLAREQPQPTIEAGSIW